MAGIRDVEALAKRTEAGRKDWQALWTDVDGLLHKSGGGRSK